MDIEKIEVGMKVLVADNLDKTKLKWTFGSSDVMPKMKGLIAEVMYLEGDDGVALRGYDGMDWIFCPEDLRSPNQTPPIPPVMFDPESIFD